MPKVMKPPTDYDDSATDTGFDGYDGPLPTPGLYKGVVKKMLLFTVKDGEKKGEQRILVICDISEGKFKGAGVSKWLQLTKQGSPWLNQFLHSISDGTEEGKARIRKAFKNGYVVGDKDAKGRYPILQIGKVKVEGLETSFVTRKRTGDDEVERAEISRFVTKFTGDDDDDSSAEDALDDSEDPMADESTADDDDSSADSDDDDSTEDDASEGETEDSEPATEEDADDPWSV